MKRATGLMALSLMLSPWVVEAQAKRKPLVLALEFIPQENVTEAAPTMDAALASRPLSLLPVVDGRETDRTLIGENREDERKPREVRTHSNVADFVSRTLRQCLTEWGIRLQDGEDLVLTGELVRLFVTERNTYFGEARIRFKLQNPQGQVLWEGIVSGDARRWGRSLSKDNYNEEISDSLKKAYAALLSDKGFQAAWAGRPNERGEKPSITAAVLKQKVATLMNEGVSTSVIVNYVRSQRVTPPITAEEIVDWKRSGIPEAVIDAVVGTASDPP